MTKDDIIRMGQQADDYANCKWDTETPAQDWKQYRDERFANLVAAAEQIRCIGIIHGQCGSDNVAQRTVDAIRSQS